MNKKTRWAAVCLGVGMHIGIDVSFDVGGFGRMMMASYILFLPGDELAALFRRERPAEPEVGDEADGEPRVPPE